MPSITQKINKNHRLPLDPRAIVIFMFLWRLEPILAEIRGAESSRFTFASQHLKSPKEKISYFIRIESFKSRPNRLRMPQKRKK